MSNQVENDLKYDDQSGYQGAKKVTLEEAMNADQGDESLKKWKDALITQAANAPKNEKHVIFDKLLIDCPAMPKKRLEFTFDEVKKSNQEKKPLFVVKGGNSFRIGYQYRVFNDIVMGLRVV